MAKTKTRSTKLPKEIAGVKVPKSVRDKGGKLMDALSHPLIADIAAAALIAAAAALRDSDGGRKAASKAKAKAGDAAEGVGKGAATLGSIAAATTAEIVRNLGGDKGKGKKRK